MNTYRLLSWNLPYAAYCRALGRKTGEASPFSQLAATPSNLTIQSPKAITPGREAAGPSPTVQLINQKKARDRSNYILQGRQMELLASCGGEDRM
jgi:hypothetical protein